LAQEVSCIPNVLKWEEIEALTILPTIYVSSESRHKNAGRKKYGQVVLSTSMLIQIQKSEKSNIKVKIMFKKKNFVETTGQCYILHN
jgi:hypothetical protein